MQINIDLKRIKKILTSKRFLITAAAVCAVAVVLIVTFFARYVFDCVGAEKSINVLNENRVKYRVYYDKNKIAGTDLKEVIDPSVDTDPPKEFIYKYVDRIEVYNSCFAGLTKDGQDTEIVGLKALYKITKTFVIKNQGAIVMSVKDDITDSLSTACESEPSCAYADITQNKGYFALDILEYKTKYDDFAKQNKDLRLTGELWIEFEFTAYTAVGSEIAINSTTKRGIIIPVSSSTFKVDYSGQAALSKNFPERKIRFPGTLMTILATLGTALFAAGLIISLKTLLEEKDAYKKAVKGILRKYGDEIVMADPLGALPDCSSTTVQSYKELAKFSQTMNKPVICLQTDSKSTFYIVCDNMLYCFNISAAAPASV